MATPLPVVAAKSESLDQRVERLERILRSQSLADIVLQMDRLQREVQQLRGQVEEQNHALEQMRKRQRDLYLDIDQRLGQAGQRGAVAVPAPPAAAASVPPPGPATPPTVPKATPAATIPANPAREEAEYQKAFKLLQQERYPEAVKAFRDLLERYPGGAYADNAQYWLGEVSYVSRDFPAALTEFSRVIDGYPGSPKVADALLKSGYIHYELGQWSQARELLNRVKQDYPASSAARLADKRLQKMRLEGH